jgi:hypothetical protein
MQHLQSLFVCTSQVMRRIVDDTWLITYPPYMSLAAKDLVSRLLERKPARRIGASYTVQLHVRFLRYCTECMRPPRRKASYLSAECAARHGAAQPQFCWFSDGRC